MSATLERNDVGMYLRFAKSRIPVSLEFADNFIVDFSPDDDIVGLEFLYPCDWRDDWEPALLAFGVFGSALVWAGYHYAAHSGPKMRWATMRKAKEFVSAAGLGLQVAAYASNGLTISDADGKVLLCADFRYHPRRVLKSAYAPKSTGDLDLTADGMAEIRAAIKHLIETALPSNPGAVGVAVAVDETPNLRKEAPVAPGRWVKLPKSQRLFQVEAHIAILPPPDCAYSWLPKHFLDLPE